MPYDRCPPADEAEGISARITAAERTQSALLVLLDELDRADLPLAATHVSAAVDQIRFDLDTLKSIASLMHRNGE